MCVYIYITLYPSSVDRHLHCIHVLATVNGATMNVGVYESFQNRVFAFSRYMPRSGIAGSFGSSNFSVLGTSMLSSVVAAPTDIPTNSVGSLFSIPFPAFIICRIFDDTHSDW